MGQIKATFVKLSYIPCLGKDWKVEVYPPHPPRSALQEFFDDASNS